MGKPITLDGVQGCLDESFSEGKYIGKEQGADKNIQVSLNNLKGLSDYDKCKSLVEAANVLHKEGYIDDVHDAIRLSFDTKETDSNGKPIYAPWPCLWVNHPSKTDNKLNEVTSVSAENAKKIDALGDQMTQFMNQMMSMMQGQGATPTNVKKDDEETAPF